MVVDGRGLVRPGGRRGAAGDQELLDAVHGHLLRQRLRGTRDELGVVGVHRDLLELVPGHGTRGLRRLRGGPPRPAAAVRAGLAQGVEQLLRGLGQPGDQGLALRRHGRTGQGGGGVGADLGRPGGHDDAPVAAPLPQVPHQVAQRPVGAGRHLRVEVGGGGDRGAEGRRPLVDQTEQVGKVQGVMHTGCLSP